MFTGIVQEIGRVVSFKKQSQGGSLVIQASQALNKTKVGDSIATNGVCLTISQLNGSTFTADLSPETLNRTYFRRLKPGDQVNLEPALCLGDRLGGHLVTGHIDGLARLSSCRKEGAFANFSFQIPYDWCGVVVRQGSVAVDGVSLTVADCQANQFSVALIPQTLETTILQYKKAEDLVHLEFDVVGKYVQALLLNGCSAFPLERSVIKEELLTKYGY